MSQAPLPDAPVSEDEKLDWLRLARTENVGPITFYKLIERFGSAGEALAALPELSKRGGRKKPLVAPHMNEIEREYERLRKLGGTLITALCPDYPLALSALDDAPPVLSALGNADLMKKSCVGLVGARNCSLNGRKMTQRLAQDLGARGHVVVSGMARGIDTAAHEGSLQSGTIAVVAGGIDVIYPPENAGLYEQIKERGLVLAESALGQKPFAQSFPRRNRIVSGLSDAVVVVEATMRSGSLITGRMAGEQGRTLCAVPGSPLDPRAAGPNHLIREGAQLVTCAQDVIELLHNFEGTELREHGYQKNFVSAPLDVVLPDEAGNENIPQDAQERILDLLSFTPIAVDEIARSCDLTISVMQTVLLELELAGRIKRSPGGFVSLLGEE